MSEIGGLADLAAMRLRLLLAALLLPLAACDSGEGETALAPGTFTLRVDDQEAQTRADAYAGTFVAAETGDAFAILLGSDPAEDSGDATGPVVALVRLGSEPGTGEFALSGIAGAPLTPGGGFALGIYLDPSRFEEPADRGDLSVGGFYLSTSGSFTIEEIDDERVVGRFAMTAAPMGRGFGDGGTGESVEVSGEFHALVSDDFEGTSVLARRALPVTIPL